MSQFFELLKIIVSCFPSEFTNVLVVISLFGLGGFLYHAIGGTH